VGWQLFPDDARQALRLKRFFMAALSYVLWVGLTLYCYLLGYVNLSLFWFIFFISLALAGNLAIFAVLRSGMNLRWSDPSLTLPQMLVATFWVMLLVALAPRVRGILLLLYVVIFLFGIFRLRRSEYLWLTVLVLLGYGGMVLREIVANVNREPLSLELLQYAVLIVTLIWLAFFGSYVGRLRDTVAKRNRELGEALRRNRELAIHDDLTGTFNRRHILAILEQERSRALRTGRGFGVCLMDIDHFKEINDRHGHLAGDEILREFAERVLGEIRELDRIGRDGVSEHQTFGRYGGEEFLLVLPETDAEGTRICGERIRTRIAIEHFKSETAEANITVSIGITTYCPDEHIRETLARADRALYRAKHNGRNRMESLLPE
jgi:diguanylate cyclase